MQSAIVCVVVNSPARLPSADTAAQRPRHSHCTPVAVENAAPQLYGATPFSPGFRTPPPSRPRKPKDSYVITIHLGWDTRMPGVRTGSRREWGRIESHHTAGAQRSLQRPEFNANGAASVLLCLLMVISQANSRLHKQSPIAQNNKVFHSFPQNVTHQVQRPGFLTATDVFSSSRASSSGNVGRCKKTCLCT